ncbi:MAG: GNAT superfamily N-acetyltransferase [Chlamydiales bacterium]|jgi:GNAT superfamily N-acetyltransferase
MRELEIVNDGVVEPDEVVELYTAHEWSSASKPVELVAALRNSHSLVTARLQGKLVGLANAISDGHLVVYYPHLLVHPEHQGQGIGRRIMAVMQERYSEFHQQILIADADAVKFYDRVGFERAGRTLPMWIYDGSDH